MWKSPLLEGSLNMPRFLFCVSRCETACGNAQLAPGMAIIHHVVLHLLWSRDPKPIIFRIEVSQRCFQTILFLRTMNNRTVIRSKIGPANCEQCFKYQNFHTRKLGGIAGFFAVKHTFSRIYSLSVMQISVNMLEAYLAPWQTSIVKLFPKIVNTKKRLSVFVKHLALSYCTTAAIRLSL